MKIKISLPWLIETEFEIKIGKNDKKIAWQLYCELVTRVGVVEFIEDEDIIVYCLDSWYSFFQFAREKLKDLKPRKKSKKAERDLPLIILKLLNEQLRPFLRKWHGQFRHFWDKEADQKLYPVKRQKSFPKYNKLVEDLKKLQIKLKQTSEALLKIAKS